MKLDEVLSVDCDVQLKLDDGVMPAGSTALRMISGVFNNALDAANGCQTSIPSKASSGIPCPPVTGSRVSIPLPGVTKEQWLRIAEFLYPVVPCPEIKDWEEADYMLEVGGWVVDPAAGIM
jgi:hypothetical protein